MNRDDLMHVILRGLFLLGLMGAAFLVGLLLMDKVIMPGVVGTGGEVLVPDVTERSSEEAQRILNECGLSLVTESEMHDPVVPEGYIISQAPKAYTKAKKGRGVHVTVSRGNEQIAVPDLVTRGISLRTAEIELSNAGLELGSISYQASDRIPKGVVISQSPSRQALSHRGGLVSVTVSSGPQASLSIVPDVVGLDVESAIFELKEVGLSLGNITYIQQADLLPETVVSQSVPAGDGVDRGTTVDLVVTR